MSARPARAAARPWHAALARYRASMARAALLLRRWREELEGWAIPEPIARQAEASPWELPVDAFERRAVAQLAAPAGQTFARAREALEPPGVVLDVGAGAGAGSLPLAGHMTLLVAVDEQPAMLERLEALARGLGVPVRSIAGTWPAIAPQVPVADVVVCVDVLYNVPELEPFVAELTGHARRRVVVEIPERHPLTVLRPLWRRFHGLERPAGPTAAQAAEALAALGLGVQVERWTRPPRSDLGSFEDVVELTRRRLCLPRERAPEVAAALAELGGEGPAARPQDLASAAGQQRVTLWWPGRARG